MTSEVRRTGGDGLKPITAADVASRIGGELRGDGAVQLLGIAPLDRAGPTDLSLLSHERYADAFIETRAGAVIVAPQFASMTTGAQAVVIVDRPVEAMVPMLAHFHRPEPRPVGIDPTARIADDATIGANVTIEAYAVIASGAVIGEGSWIGAHCVVGANAMLGNDVRLYPAATVYARAELGDRVVLHSGARVGREGFGFVPRDSGPVRIPHVGRCVLEHDVEVGANSCIDRGSINDTVIGAGTKIDNLVMIGHNVRVGRMCFIASQAGIAGSVHVGDGVQIGGQAGIKDHVSIGSRSILAAQTGVVGDIPPGETWSGYPARPHREQMRAHAALHRLTKMLRSLEALISAREPR